jgi:hypothetical protein
MSSRTSAQSSSKSRKLTQLNSNTEKKLLGYAALAGASGVGILALVQPAEAEVVFTPTHQTLGEFHLLDLNGDGIADFSFEAYFSSTLTQGRVNLRVYGIAKTNQILGERHHNIGVASALPSGAEVGPNAKFAASNTLMGAATFFPSKTDYFGPWAPKGGQRKDRFLGLKFVIDGQIHYGWARFNVRIRPPNKGILEAVLTGYAYETDVNTPLETGQTSGPESAETRPGTLGQLALGAPGLVPWRRELEEEGQKGQP